MRRSGLVGKMEVLLPGLPGAGAADVGDPGSRRSVAAGTENRLGRSYVDEEGEGVVASQ